MSAVEGTWSGRLIDVGGFEGEVTLTLQGGRDKVEGMFDAMIAGQHHPTRIRGRVSGTQKGDPLSLRLDVGQTDTKITASLDSDVFKTRQGDRAACGVYAVSARQSSALMGGVISVRQAVADKPLSEGFVRSAVAQVQGGADTTPARAAPARKRRARGAPKRKTSKRRRSRS